MPSADFVFTPVRAFTADPGQPWAEAVATRGERIVFVGSAAEAQAWSGPDVRRVDGQGATLLPGFIDSHFHLRWGALALGDASLGQAGTLDEMARLVRRHAVERPREAWLKGGGLLYSLVPAGLTRFDLDALIPDRPLVLMAYDLHTAWANTRALEAAGLLRGAVSGPNSAVVLGADGLATGELREPAAYNLLLERLPPPSAARRQELLRRGLRQAAEFGLTSVHNMDGDFAQAAEYAALDQAGDLSLRVYVPFSVTPATTEAALAEAAEMRRAFRVGRVRAGSAKFFMDGVVESFTALLLDDYAERPGWRGEALYSLEHFTRLAAACDQLGLQVITHAVGDGAVRRTLDGLERVLGLTGRLNARHRIEHIELIHPADRPRFAQLGVLASMQPLHAPLGPPDPDPWPARVGPARWPRAFAWADMRQSGARLAFGSDWPVASPDPLAGLRAAVNRAPWAPGLPDQRQTLAEAVLAYTREAAYAEFQEHEKGQLKVGRLADLVLLDRDLFAAPPESLGAARVRLTMVGGQVVYE